MLLNKDTQKLFEFKGYFKSHTQAFSNIIKVFGVFSKKSITMGIFINKIKGHSSTTLLQMLILMPFLGAQNIYSIFSTHYQLFYNGKKDSLYDILRDPTVNW